MSTKKILLQKKYEGLEDQVIRYGNDDTYEAVDSYSIFITPQIVIDGSDENSGIIDYQDENQDLSTYPVSYGCRRIIGQDIDHKNIYDIDGIVSDKRPVWYRKPSADESSTNIDDYILNQKRVVFLLSQFGEYVVEKRYTIYDDELKQTEAEITQQLVTPVLDVKLIGTPYITSDSNEQLIFGNLPGKTGAGVFVNNEFIDGYSIFNTINNNCTIYIPEGNYPSGTIFTIRYYLSPAPSVFKDHTFDNENNNKNSLVYRYIVPEGSAT